MKLLNKITYWDTGTGWQTKRPLATLGFPDKNV